MKNNSLEYRKIMNLDVNYNNMYQGFIKLKQNPNIEYFNQDNIIFRSEKLLSPKFVYGLVLNTGNNCRYYRDFAKKIKIGLTEKWTDKFCYICIIINILFAIVNLYFDNFRS
jgi:hypothetical protein